MSYTSLFLLVGLAAVIWLALQLIDMHNAHLAAQEGQHLAEGVPGEDQQ